MSDLRNKVIKLAHDKPELRPHLLPVLAEGKTAAYTDMFHFVGNFDPAVWASALPSYLRKTSWKVNMLSDLNFTVEGSAYNGPQWTLNFKGRPMAVDVASGTVYVQYHLEVSSPDLQYDHGVPIEKSIDGGKRST
ncbi:MAG TPA: hypothetical protein V6D20_23880, partial [Candidatus Obscuribacterales bacterium]